MKKNIIVLVAAVALVILAVPTIAVANGMHQAWAPAGGAGSLAHHAMRAAGEGDAAAAVEGAIASVRGAYVDRNNDGVCDNYTGNQQGQQGCPGYVDEDGDGICDNCTNGQSACPGYVDADNDGICDNYGSGACGAGHGHGCGNGTGAGNGAGYGNGHHGRMHR